MTPETKARQQIDQKLQQAGWAIQGMKQLNLGAAVGVAVREYPTDTENQTERYANATLKWRKDSTPLRFLFEATGQIIRFTDGADPVPRSREIFHVFKPETLSTWLAQSETLRRRLAEQMPALPERNLRDCQMALFRPRAKAIPRNAATRADHSARSWCCAHPHPICAARPASADR